ncbi:MAG: winged helix-turn-helix domain-containing protein [Pseudonocardia sp.]|nr:winged helix-turn-helix domain-containing protein [Pseudonocardia sp.]
MPDANDRSPLRVEVLGPLRLVVHGAAVEVRGPKRRAVLALLALAEGRAVSVDHLVDALWPGEVPESGRQALHSHVSRLRGHLGSAADRLETLDGGYRLTLGRTDLDVAQARALLAGGRAHAAADPVAATARLREAHALWRGPVLSDLSEVASVATANLGLEQLHHDVTDTLVGCAVAAARLDPRQVDGVVDVATAALAADPLREPAVLALMRALAVTGRATDALRAGREYRHRLAEDAGLDPSPALGELERDIARGASGPATAPPARPAAPSRPTTRLIGREGQVAALRRMLGAERLVTIVGPGGVGKTRVALEVAAGPDARQEATVLLLAPVTDAAAIPHALAAALDLQVVHGDVLAACAAMLRTEPRLLVVDNCEHLIDTVRDAVATLLDGCPDLRVLSTSREPLGLAAERVSRLAPLPVPTTEPGHDGRHLPDVPSVAIFLDRASRVRPDLAPGPAELRLVADVVRRLDGIPLAIELAAGRLSTLSLPDLHERLDRSLDLLGGGRVSVDARHRTLRATVEWSYQLLGDDERTLFRHLSVFVDGVDLGTAEDIAAGLGLAEDPGSLLARLVDASMIDAVFEGPTRYRMLETLRAFGRDRLVAGGEDGAADARLLRWAVELTAWIDTAVTTDREPDADAVLRREVRNLRAAWRLARSQDTLDDATVIVQSLFGTVFNRDLVEIRGWSGELAADPALAGHPRAPAVLGTAAYAAYLRGDQPEADRLAHAGLDLAGDRAESSYCRHASAVAALARGAFDEAVEHCRLGEQANPHPRHGFLGLASLATTYTGDLDTARTLHQQAALAAVGSQSVRGWVAYYGGEIENAAGRAAPAEEHYGRAIALARTAGATFLLGVASVGLLSVRAAAGRVQEALSGYREVIDYWATTGNWTHQWTTLRNLADLLRRLGDTGPAGLIDAAAEQAPDAPAVAPSPDAATPLPPGPAPSRAQVLDAARRAIERHLDRS